MSDIQSRAFDSKANFVSCLMGQLTSPAYSVEVHQLRLPEPGSGVFSSKDYCFLEYAEQPENQLRRRFGRFEHSGERRVGQLVFIPPGTSLEWQWSAGYQRAVTCMFRPEALGAAASYSWEWGSADLRDALDIGSEYLRVAMRRLGQEAVRPGFASDLTVESLLTFVALELKKQFVGGGDIALKDLRNDRSYQVGQIKLFVRKNLDRDMRVSDIAEAFNQSPVVLSKIFKETTGMTLRKYIADARIEKAKGLLGNRRLLIKQVGFECGYRGPAAFVAAFRESTGIAPAEYRLANFGD